MSKKRTQRTASPPRKRPSWLLPGIVILALAAIAAIVAVLAGNNQSPYVPEITGAPRAEVAETTIDHGPQPFGQQVESLFRVRNVGDQPLMVASNPQIETIEGC